MKLVTACLLLLITSPLPADDIQWVERYDWYKDSYIMGWKSEKFGLVYNPKVADVGNGTVRSEISLSDTIGFRYELLTRGRDDFGPSIRFIKRGAWSAHFEPSWGRGEPGIFMRMPIGPIGKLKLGTAKTRQLAWKGIKQGGIYAFALVGTKPPKGQFAQIAEHVGARTARRFIFGASAGIAGIITEALITRVFRSFGSIFDKIFDGPNTKGLTVTYQTLSDEYQHELKRMKKH